MAATAAAENPLPTGRGSFDAGELEDYTQPRAKQTPAELFFATAFYVALLAQVVIGSMILAGVNTAMPITTTNPETWQTEVECPEGFELYGYSACYTTELVADVNKCAAARRLAGLEVHPRRLDTETAESLWVFLEQNGHVVGTIFAAMIVMAVGWLAAFRKCARVMVWSMLLVNVLLLIYVKSFIVAIVLVVVAACFRAKIDTAAVLMQEAVKGLQANPSLWVYNSGIQLLFLAYATFWCAMIASAAHHKTVDPDVCLGCTPCEPVYVKETRLFFGIAFVVTSKFLSNAKLIITSTVISTWYFPKPAGAGAAAAAAQPSPAAVGLRWSFVEMSGANSMASAIQTVVDFIRNAATNKCVACQTCGILWCIWQCVGNCVQQFSRFGLIGSVISGKGYVDACVWSFKTVQDHLGQAVLTGTVSSMVMVTGTYLLSTAFAFLAMFWADDNSNTGIFGNGDDTALIQFFAIWLVFWIRMPYLTLLLCCILGNVEDLSVVGNFIWVILFGMFVGAIAHLFFRYVSEFVLATTDVIFLSFCFERSRGRQQPERFSELYDNIKKNVVDGTVASSPDVEVGRPVVPPTPAAAAPVGNTGKAEEEETAAGGA